jgi:predicted O-methyltransferase YrrM
MLEGDKQDFILPVPHYTVARFLAHYELFKMIKDVPGDIVDIGVGRGGSSFAWAKMLRAFNRPGTVYGFDTFEGFPHVAPEDGAGVRERGMNLGRAALDAAQAHPNRDLPLRFVIGDITQTVPPWALGHSDFRIALLNLDADLYAPTKVALEYLMPLMAPGGVVILDEYDVADFPGEKRAFDEYFSGRPVPLLHRFPWYNNPSRYFIV